MNTVPLDAEHEEEIEEMENPVVIEGERENEIREKLAKMEVLENVLEQRQRVLDRAS